MIIDKAGERKDLLIQVPKKDGVECTQDFGKGPQNGVIIMEDVSGLKKADKDKYVQRIAEENNKDKLDYAVPYAKNSMQFVKDENGKKTPKTYTNEKGETKTSYSHMQSISPETLQSIKDAAGKKGVYSTDKFDVYAVSGEVSLGKGEARIDTKSIQASSVDKSMTEARWNKQEAAMSEIVETKNSRVAELKAAEKAAKDASLGASASKSVPEAPAKDSAEKGLGE